MFFSFLKFKSFLKLPVFLFPHPFHYANIVKALSVTHSCQHLYHKFDLYIYENVLCAPFSIAIVSYLKIISYFPAHFFPYLFYTHTHTQTLLFVSLLLSVSSSLSVNLYFLLSHLISTSIYKNNI